MFEISTEDVALSAVFGKGFSFTWSIVYQQFHSDVYIRGSIVVVLAVHLGVC